MHCPKDLAAIEGMDIYLVDQILKGRYSPGQSILDAGCGGGRNLNWFFSQKGFEVHACDLQGEREDLLKERYPGAEFSWATCDIDDLPFEDEKFDHIICNAVLHFASDESHFRNMFEELIRVLKVRGSIFIRACSEIGIEKRIVPLGQRRFLLPDGSERFLVDREMIHAVKDKHHLEFLEPLKSVNVSDERVMTTLVMVKSS